MHSLIFYLRLGLSFNVLSGLEIDFNAFKKDSRPRQGEDKHEKDVPGHLKLALTVFAFIMMISVVLAFAFKWLD